jgi:hypothetical protein
LAAAIEYADARWSGVDVPIEWARHFADAIGKPYASPPAQPAPVQEPIYQMQMMDGKWIDQAKQSYEYNKAHGHTVRIVYTTPPAAPAQSCYCPNCEALGKELAALKAQPAPAPGYCKHCKQYTIEEPLTAAQPAPTVQEPVAWQVMVEDEAMKEFSVKDAAHDWCVQQKLGGSHYSYWIRPLYTDQPAEPVPLTDEQINKLRQQYGVTSDGRGIKEFTYVVDFARAIEAHHGITKGQP